MRSFDNEQRLRLLQVSCMLFFILFYFLMRSSGVKFIDKGRGVEVDELFERTSGVVTVAEAVLRFFVCLFVWLFCFVFFLRTFLRWFLVTGRNRLFRLK